MPVPPSDPTDPIPGTRVEYIAVVASMGLYGITCMQTFMYYANQRKGGDRWPIHILVAFLWAMDTTHQIITNRGFWVLISRVHDPFILSQEYLWAGLFTSLVTLPTQLFFVMRIWKISKKKWIVPLIFVPCSLFQFGGYIAFLVLCLNGGPTAEIIYVIRKLPMAFWGVGAAEDVLISMCLIYLLWHNRDRGGFRSTERLIYRLTVFAVNTGLWTSLCALFVIVTMAAYPNIQTYVALYLVVCPLYCNTLLANLNGRGFIRGDDFTEPISLGPSQGRIAFTSFPSTGPPISQETTMTLQDLPVPSHSNHSSLKLEKAMKRDEV